MNDLKQRFAKNATWTIIGRVFQIGITFITTMLVARYLGPEKYGTITYTYSYVVIFSSLATLGLNDIVVKELLNKENNKEEVLGTMVFLKFFASILSIGLIYLVISIVNDNKVVRLITFLQSLSIIFQIFDTLTYYYQSELLSKKTAIITIISYSLTTLFRVIGLINKYNTDWFAFAVSLDFLIVSLLTISLFYKEGFRLHFNIKLVKTLLGKSYNYIFASLMIGIYTKIDTILLGNMIDEKTVGYYTAATTICNAWPFVLQAIIDSAKPIIIDLFDTNKNEYKKRFRQLYASIFYVSLFVGLIILVFSPLIINILYGKEYALAAIPLRIVCFSTAFSYFGVARGTWMQCENKIKYEKIIYLFGAISDVILNFVLINRYGIIGAAIAITLTQFLTNFIFVYLHPATRENGKLMLDGILLKGVLK